MAATVHRRAAARASDGGPIAAADIVDTTPVTLADLLAATTEARHGHDDRRPPRHRREIIS